MTDLIIQGINGRMGHTLVEKISARSDCRIVAGVDQKAGQIGDIPVYASLEDLPEAKGIVIDFTSMPLKSQPHLTGSPDLLL